MPKPLGLHDSARINLPLAALVGAMPWADLAKIIEGLAAELREIDPIWPHDVQALKAHLMVHGTQRAIEKAVADANQRNKEPALTRKPG